MAKQKQTPKPERKRQEKDPKKRSKDLPVKDDKAADVKGGRYTSWSDRRLKTGIRPF